MALNVVLFQTNADPNTLGTIILNLRDDGYYWYLSSYWPSSSSTGKLIDLYGTAVFRGPNLAQLNGCLARAAESLNTEPESWEERIGTRPDGRGVYSIVNKAKLLALINKLQKAVSEAEISGMEIRFIGD
jgi:hypothetical protein